MADYQILVINCGSTSTKVALFRNDTCVVSENLPADPEAVKNAKTIADQLPSRLRDVRGFIEKHDISLEAVDMIASRGGPTPYCEGGAYRVNRKMIDVLIHEPVTTHASTLSCMIGRELAGDRIPCIIYDSLTTDEMIPIAKVTGFPGVENKGGGHVLNSRAVAHMTADRLGRRYEDCRLIVVHIGGGVSTIAHVGGKEVDIAYGAMTPERAGALQSLPFINTCFSGRYTKADMMKIYFGTGGLKHYLGTSDVKEIADRAQAGEEQYAFYLDAMIYRLAKDVGQLAAALDGDVDAIVITGGTAQNEFMTGKLSKKIRFIAPVEVIPGELEMEALAAGAVRVLRGEEQAREYDVLPAGTGSWDAFYEKYGHV